MTTLDRAFIKAFAGSAPEPAAAEQPQPPQPAEDDELIVLDVESPPSGTPDRRDVAAAAEQDARLPLSSFAAPPKVHDSCRPQLEIDRAEWPSAVRDLLARAGRQFDSFTEQIIQRASRGQKTIAIASTGRNDGRTTFSLALAKHAARRGLRLVVADADLENPALVRSCGVSAQTGWDDLVTSELALGEALISVVEDRVTLLPWRGRQMSLAELAGSMRAAGVFGTLRELYDLVVLDTMPLGGRTSIADFAAFATAIHLDAVYLVHNVRTTSRDGLLAVGAKLRRAGLPLAGVIENFVSPDGSDEPQGATRSPAGRQLAARG